MKGERSLGAIGASWALKLADERIFLSALAVFTFNLAFSEALKEIFLVVAFLLILLRLFLQSGPWSRKILFLGFPVVAFSTVSLVSAMNSINRLQALHGFWGDFEALMAWVAYSGAFFLAGDRMKALRIVAISLMLGVLAGGATGIYRMLFLNDPNMEIMNLGDKNSTAQLLSSVFLFLLALGTVRTQAGLSRGFLLVSLVSTGGLLVLCHSRSFLISVPVASVAILLITRMWKSMAATVLAMALTGAVLTLSPLLKWEMATVIHPSEDGSFTSRYLTWQGALRIFHDRPLLGVGPDTFHMPNIHAIYHLPDYASHGHNLFFNLLGEYGLLGVLSFAGLLLFWASRVLRDRDPDGPVRFIKALSAGFLLNLLLAGVAHPMWGGSYSLFLMLVMALTLVMEDSLHDGFLRPGFGNPSGRLLNLRRTRAH